MKPETHPEYHLIKVEMTDGTVFETRSTWGEEGQTLKLEVDPKTHPAWTGGERLVLDAGQVSRFKKRYGDFGLE